MILKVLSKNNLVLVKKYISGVFYRSSNAESPKRLGPGTLYFNKHRWFLYILQFENQ